LDLLAVIIHKNNVVWSAVVNRWCSAPLA